MVTSGQNRVPPRGGTREEVVREVAQEQADIHAATGSRLERDPSARRRLGTRAVGAALVAGALGAVIAVLVGAIAGVGWPETLALALCLTVVFGVLGWLVTALPEDGWVNRRVERRRPRAR